MKRPDATNSANRLFLVLVAAIFFGEMLVMLLLELLPRLSPLNETLLDSTLLLILIFPVLYQFVLRPTTTHIAGLQQANEAREEALSRLQQIASRVPGIVFEFRLRADGSSCVPYASEAIREIYRVGPVEVRDDASPIFAAVHPDDLPEHRASIETSAKNLTPWQQEYRLKFEGEADLWLLGNALPQREADGSVLWHGFITDITERKRAELALQKSEARFRSLTELSSDWYWEQDRELRLSFHSSGFAQGSGTTSDKLLGKRRWEEPNRFPLRGTWEEHRAKLDAHESFRDFEYVRVGDDGEQYFVALSGVPIFDAAGEFNGYRGVGKNITERKRAEAALQKSEARFRSLTALSSDWYWEQDENFRFTDDSGGLQERIGSDEHLGKTRWELPTLGVSEDRWATHRADLDAHRPFRNFQFALRSPKRGVIHLSVSGVPIFDEHGMFKGYRGCGSDITRRKAAEDEIKNLAFYDPLTQLPNRRLLMDRLGQALTASSRHRRNGAVLFIDLDNFKTLNDTLGHDIGDLLLQQTGERLLKCVREGDTVACLGGTVARLGGDEFVVMLEDLSENAQEAASQVETVGERILVALNHTYKLGGHIYHNTPSIGITLFANHQGSIDDLLKRADLAMYQAKAAGRNTLRFYDGEMQAVITSRAALEAALREAVHKDQFLLYYQAQVAGEGRLTGAEALLRWQHPERGMVSPAEFIPLAEETGLILTLGQWVLETVCVQLALWAARSEMADLTVAVNVSARQLHHRDFVDQVLAVLEHTGANPQRLKLELTESLLVDNVEDVIAKMSALKAKGVGFSLDDFGTGYSSLSYLKRLPLDQLKIDRSFVRDILTDPIDAAIAKMVIVLAESLDLDVIAEGVEIEAQRDFLARQGCHAYQGYLFSRPLPLAEFQELVKRA